MIGGKPPVPRIGCRGDAYARMRIGIVGTGHVGLVTGVAFASLGTVSWPRTPIANKIRFLNAGKAPFREPGLDELLGSTHRRGERSRSSSRSRTRSRGRMSSSSVSGDPTSGTVIGAWGRWRRPSGRSREPRHPGSVVVVKSTVPPGTTERAARVIRAERPDLEVDVVSSPEFLREGHALEDTLAPDRLVIGSTSPRATRRLLDLYAEHAEQRSAGVRHGPRDRRALQARIERVPGAEDLVRERGGSGRGRSREPTLVTSPGSWAPMRGSARPSSARASASAGTASRRT